MISCARCMPVCGMRVGIPPPLQLGPAVGAKHDHCPLPVPLLPAQHRSTLLAQPCLL
jgi:hypothetical protein